MEIILGEREKAMANLIIKEKIDIKSRYQRYMFFLRSNEKVRKTYDEICKKLRINYKEEVPKVVSIHNILKQNFIIIEETALKKNKKKNFFYTCFPWIELGDKVILNRIALTALTLEALREVWGFNKMLLPVFVRVLNADKKFGFKQGEYKINYGYPAISYYGESLMSFDTINPSMNERYLALIAIREFSHSYLGSERDILPYKIEMGIIESITLALFETALDEIVNGINENNVEKYKESQKIVEEYRKIAEGLYEYGIDLPFILIHKMYKKLNIEDREINGILINMEKKYRYEIRRKLVKEEEL